MAEGAIRITLFEKMSKETVISQITEQLSLSSIDNEDEILPEILFKKNQGESTFRFVGCMNVEIAGRSCKLYSFPKYLNLGKNDEATEDYEEKCYAQMPSILRVIEKTRPRDFELDSFFHEIEYNKKRVRVSREDLARWIVGDYLNNGLFRYKKSRNTKQLKGRINWGKTISSVLPFPNKDGLVYAEQIHTFCERSTDSIISEIHRCVVGKAIEKLSEYENNPHLYPPEYDRALANDLGKYVGVVQKYQRCVYTNRDIGLLRALEAWCSNTNYYQSAYIGTVSFDLVWEDCVRAAFGHAKIGKNVRSNNKMDFSFGKPQYTISGKKLLLNNDSIPDVINIWRGEKEEFTFLLLDAKYYLGEIGKEISGVPGYKDIAKQLDYFHTLYSRYGLNPIKGYNAFVLPEWSGLHTEETKEPEGPLRFLGAAQKGEGIEEDPIWGIIGKEKKNEKDNPEIMGKEHHTEYVYILQINPSELYEIVLSAQEENMVQERCADLWKLINNSSLNSY